MTKTLRFEKVAAQGELIIIKVSNTQWPQFLDTGHRVAPENGKLIVGHSETGHHHVVDADCAELTRASDSISYLYVKEPTELKHLRDYDTHPSIALQPGMYQFRTGREYNPFSQEIRLSQD